MDDKARYISQNRNEKDDFKSSINDKKYKHYYSLGMFAQTRNKKPNGFTNSIDTGRTPNLYRNHAHQVSSQLEYYNWHVLMMHNYDKKNAGRKMEEVPECSTLLRLYILP